MKYILMFTTHTSLYTDTVGSANQYLLTTLMIIFVLRKLFFAIDKLKKKFTIYKREKNKLREVRQKSQVIDPVRLY